MEDSALLSLLEIGRNIAALLVAIGVVGEFAGEFMARPVIHRIEASRQAEMGRLTAATESARRDIADASARIAEAEARAAEANKLAEQERLERVKIEERLAPRSLTSKQQEEIAKNMKPLGPQRIDFFMYPNDVEVNGIAQQVANALRGWQVVGFQPLGGGNVSGMLVEFDPNDKPAAERAAMLVSSLSACGLIIHGPTASLPTPPDHLPAMLTGAIPVGATIRLTIGKK